MATLQRFLLCALAVVLTAFFGFILGRWSVPPPTITERIERDTIIVREVVPGSVRPSRTEIADLPRIVWATEYLRDTTYLHDTVRVAIPLSLYTFEGTDYRAEVEGWGVSLHKIEVYPQTIYRTTTQKVPSRWGVGIQGGVGFVGSKFTPYIGIGVHYSIFSW